MARKILLADDSVTAQNMGRKILTDAGYDVITVNNGSAALKRVAEHKPDLIVLDVYMPGYSGLEVCVRLKDAPETARIPVLLTVGKLEPFKPEEATRVRADGFIVKPFEASELLSALTRLEDRMVPSQAEGARFSGSVSGVERFSGGDPSVKKSSEDDAESGWKNRLRFPSKKKKEELEPEPEPDFVTPLSFRDFRKGGGKAPAGTNPFPLSNAPAGAQEPGLVPDIPRDITPEELDALSELAAKLDGVRAAEQEAAIGGKNDPPAADTAAPEAAAHESADEKKIELQAPAVAEAVKESFEVSPPSGQAIANQTVDAPPAPVEPIVAEAVTYKTETAVAQEPAPIDREDEPAFALAAAQADAPEAQGETMSSARSAPIAEPAVVEAAVQPAPVEEAKSDEPPRADESVAAVASSSPEAPAAESSSPSAEELAEALRFLTPSQATEVPQSLAEAGAALAHELAEGAKGVWVAEAVPLSPEEATGSLETEMFRSFSQGGSASMSAVVAESPADQTVLPVASAPVEEVAVTAADTSVMPSQTEPDEAVAQVQADSEEPVAATTFADAVRSQDDREEVGVPAAVTEADAEVASSDQGPGGESAMGKETKGKGGKSNWHQIRSGVPAASDTVEAAKQSDEPPKTMAAAASADGASEASQIANIVDSVLADLRPKIVEEIAKQLSKK